MAPQTPPTHKAPKSCALHEVVGHATNNCPELPQLKYLVHEAFLELNILNVHVEISIPPNKIKMLHINHPCSLCDLHGHYSRCFLISTSFVIALGWFVITRPLIVEPLILYLWIWVLLVNQNMETLAPLW